MRFLSDLSPQQLPDTDEHTPQPLVDGQSSAGEGLPTKLNNDDLRRANKGQVNDEMNILNVDHVAYLKQNNARKSVVTHFSHMRAVVVMQGPQAPLHQHMHRQWLSGCHPLQPLDHQYHNGCQSLYSFLTSVLLQEPLQDSDSDLPVVLLPFPARP